MDQLFRRRLPAPPSLLNGVVIEEYYVTPCGPGFRREGSDLLLSTQFDFCEMGRFLRIPGIIKDGVIFQLPLYLHAASRGATFWWAFSLNCQFTLVYLIVANTVYLVPRFIFTLLFGMPLANHRDVQSVSDPAFDPVVGQGDLSLTKPL